MYLGANKKISIICPRHGEFSAVASTHVLQTRKNRGGCPFCAKESVHNSLSVSKDEFVRRARIVHGDKYQYLEYHSIKKKVTIVCPIHGYFTQRGERHCDGSGCRQCFIETKAGQHLKLTTREWIRRAKIKWGETFDYSKAKYDGAFSFVTITCRKHGDFKQEARVHLASMGCPKCNASVGEEKIARFLESRGFVFERQKIITDCISSGGFPLKFDFCVGGFMGGCFRDGLVLIEYDGEQHSRPVDFFGGKERFEKCVENDSIKNNLVEKYGGNLIRISYMDFDRIDEILESYFHDSKPIAASPSNAS